MRPSFKPEEELSRLPTVEGTLIFESNWAGSLVQKATSLSFAGLFWAVWVAMWLPLLTLVVWLAAPLWGAEQFKFNVDDNLLTITLITLVGVLLGAALSAWGSLQWFQGVGKDLPEPRSSTTLPELSAFHRVDPAMLGQAWASRRLVIHHTAEGQVTLIEASLATEEVVPAMCEPVEPPPRLPSPPPVAPAGVVGGKTAASAGLSARVLMGLRS